MMQQQFIEEIKRLPIEERIALIEEISRSVREDLKSSAEGEPTVEMETIERERRVAAVQRLRGILKTSAPPPSDEELKDDYTNYLIEKYS